MKLLKSEKGFVPILILVIVVALVVGGGFYLKTRGELHNVVPGSNVSQVNSSQGNFDPVMKALGCDSQASCMQLCQKPENQSKCQQVFQQYGASRGGPSANAAIAGNNGDTTTSSLPACKGSMFFDHLPTDQGSLIGIEPLGHLNGQHVLPDQGDHVYFNMPINSDGSSNLTNVYAPGNITLIQVSKNSGYIGQDANVTDYMLEFSPCQSVIFAYDHINNLNRKILSALAGKNPTCVGGGVHTSCTYPDLSVSLSSGEKIGTAGGPGTFSTSFDFAGADVRTPILAFIDTSPAVTTGETGSSYKHAVCPLDYFTPDLKSELYRKLTIKNTGENGIPQCGTTMQDKTGTLQGNWYHEGSTQSYQGLNIQGSLAFAHSNLDASIGVLSSGSDLLPSRDLGAQILFKPQSSGFVNREPSQITPDGHVYCFDGPVAQGGNGQEGHVDIQLTSPTNLKVDYSSGACSQNPTISGNPLLYAR